MMPKPDTQAVLDGLKPFQRDTVEYVFDRLYMNPGSRRFLIADEVGLGKTLVARGVIAKAIEHLWDQVERIDVIYICSNADIARQNINRLNITGRQDFTHARRITLLPKFLHSLDSKLNFVSFTPGTSFQLKSSLGIWEERVLIYWMLRWSWDLNELGLARLMQGGVEDHDSWVKRLEGFRSEYSFDQTLTQNFCRALNSCPTDSGQSIPSIKCRFEQICAEYRRCQDPKMVPAEIARERNRLVGEVRAILARTCISALEPDVVILDEFQRFKDLLDGESDASRLARELLEYEDDTTRVRTMLLSATPYKMYTLYGEEEDHYQDFLRTVSFLQNNTEQTQELKALLKEYRRALYRYAQADSQELLRIKQDIQARLQQVMSRTERVPPEDGSDMMITENSREASPQAYEIYDYLAGQKLSEILGAGDCLEYWKSAPYLLSFMDEYKLKKSFEQFCGNEQDSLITTLIQNHPFLGLPWPEIQDFQALDWRNAKIRSLVQETIDSDLWKLLWMPPTLPYYQPQGPFANFTYKLPTKRLIFSSWAIVPKTISALLSYEADRQIFSSFESKPENSAEARREYQRLLDFRVQDERRTGMPVLAMLYPSSALARLGDPWPEFQKAMRANEHLPSLTAVREQVARKIESNLAVLDISWDTQSNRPDASWYWIAPILLDRLENRQGLQDWFTQNNLFHKWADENGEEDHQELHSGWAAHVQDAADVALNGVQHMGRPPSDLSDVLALMAIAGPAVCTLRAFSRMHPEHASAREMRNQAAKTAWMFRRIFNQPKTQALLRGMDDSLPYWRNVLEYCASGGLQAVLDEYVHILREYLGVFGHSSTAAAQEIGHAIREALSLKTAQVDVDEIQTENGCLGYKTRKMRGHFALRFGKQASEDGSSTRETQVREAFNSPFWPFVLATTSVGQEGLDFHPYCHSIVHWNLPSNPVDLEQREGRIHRYKGHAVRKNVAQAYIAHLADAQNCDPWQILFEAGNREHLSSSRGLVPYWVFPREGGASIERSMVFLPLSRDQGLFSALKQSLAVYRMVFGQARQEDLIEHLLQHLPEDRVRSLARELQMDLSPPRAL